MIYKVSFLFVALFSALLLCACGSGVSLFSARTVEVILISDGERTVRCTDSAELGEFVDRFSGRDIYSDLLDAQENGNIKVGQTELIIELQYNDEINYIEFCHIGDEYYFQRELRGRYYLTKALNQDEVEFVEELFYGDIIIIE